MDICAIQRNRGSLVIQKLPLHRTANTKVCIAIDNNEIIHFEKRETTFDGESFKKYLKIRTVIKETNKCLFNF